MEIIDDLIAEQTRIESIRGGGAAFCRVGAQRLTAAESGLITTGPFGDAALAVLRNYAA